MRKAVLISVLSIFFCLGTILFEVKALGKIYVKYWYCYESRSFRNWVRFVGKIEKGLPLNQQEIIALKKQLCKK